MREALYCKSLVILNRNVSAAPIVAIGNSLLIKHKSIYVQFMLFESEFATKQTKRFPRTNYDSFIV
jgi:hypothetical protein